MLIDTGRTLFVTAFLSENKDVDFPKHQQTDRPRFCKAVEQHLNAHPAAQTGPFVIGNTFSYADIALYQVLHDEGLTKDGRKGIKDYPRLTKLVNALEDRPNIKAFLQSDRYRG